MNNLQDRLSPAPLPELVPTYRPGLLGTAWMHVRVLPWGTLAKVALLGTLGVAVCYWLNEFLAALQESFR